MSISPCSRMNPSSASSIAGSINAVRVIVPNFFRAYSRPDTVPGTPTASQPIVLRPLMMFPSLSKYMSRLAARGAFSRKSRKIFRPSANRIVMKPPPAQIAGGRIDHGQGISHRDSGIYRTAAALENVDADLGRKVLRTDHHALFGGHGRRRGGVGG